MKNLKLFAKIAIAVLFILIFLSFKSNIFRIFSNKVVSVPPKLNEKCEKYKRECFELFRKIRFPEKSLIFNPPLIKPPDNLINEFTQNGEMPISKYSYINEAYVDSSDSFKKKTPKLIRKQELDRWRKKVKRNESLAYKNNNMKAAMLNYSSSIKNKSLVVIGTQIVWIEALGLELNASKIITLDYTRKSYEQKEFLKWFHVFDFMDFLIKHKKMEQFDNAASYSSIEHSGLGRYGDPLAPNGDLDAMKLVHCMIKPNGLFFLGLPTSSDDSSYIEFNYHRIYGSKRLNLLFKGWTNLWHSREIQNSHTLFVLKKNKFC